MNGINVQFIHPFSVPLIQHRPKKNPESLPGDNGHKPQDTMDGVSTHYRAQLHTHPFTYYGQLERDANQPTTPLSLQPREGNRSAQRISSVLSTLSTERTCKLCARKQRQQSNPQPGGSRQILLSHPFLLLHI